EGLPAARGRRGHQPDLRRRFVHGGGGTRGAVPGADRPGLARTGRDRRYGNFAFELADQGNPAVCRGDSARPRDYGRARARRAEGPDLREHHQSRAAPPARSDVNRETGKDLMVSWDTVSQHRVAGIHPAPRIVSELLLFQWDHMAPKLLFPWP